MRFQIKLLKRFVPDLGYYNHAITLVGGTAISQILIMAFSPLTRLYTPSDFGVLSSYISIVSIISVVASFRYELAITLPEDDTTALNLLVLSLLITLYSSFFFGSVIYFVEKNIIQWVSNPDLIHYLWLIPLSVLAIGVFQTLNCWAIRKEAFKIIAKTKLTQSLGQVFFQVFFGLLNLGAVGLLIGDVFGRIGGTSTLLNLVWKRSKHLLGEISFKKICEVAVIYKRFPILSSSSALLNSAGLQLPTLIILALYGPQVSGLFALVQRVIGIPMTLIGQAVAQVYLGKAPRLVNNDPSLLKEFFVESAKKLLFIGIIPIGILTLIGPKFFVLVFGEGWGGAGEYARLLSIMYIVQFVVVPLSNTLNILEKQDWQLYWDGTRLLLVVTSFVLSSYLKWEPIMAVSVYGISMLISYILLFVITIYAIQRRINEVKNESKRD